MRYKASLKELEALLSTGNGNIDDSTVVIIMKPATHFASILLATVSLAHLLRIVMGTQVTLADRVIASWVSGVTFVVAGGIAIKLWREARRKG